MQFAHRVLSARLQKKDANGNEITVAIEKDDGIREGTTMAALQRLKPAFDKGGTTTAGESAFCILFFSLL